MDPSRRDYLLVTACRNEAEFAAVALESVARQTVLPARWIIVDDGSTDRTPEILARFEAEHPYVTVVRKPDRGARSVGPGVVEAFYFGLEAVGRDSALPGSDPPAAGSDSPAAGSDSPAAGSDSPAAGSDSPAAGRDAGTFGRDPAAAGSDSPSPGRDAAAPGWRRFPFLCKHDLDLDLPPRYFEILLERMHADPRLGTCSGKPYVRRADGSLVAEPCGDEMSVGMTKFYRTECFDEVGGFVREVMWDGIDCHRARMLGWRACSWDEPELRFVHLRPMGSSQDSVLVGRMRHGYGQHFMGTGALYMLASALFRIRTPPLLLGSAAMVWGYAKRALAGQPRYGDAEFRRFLRSYQWACLLRGKRRATLAIDERNGLDRPSPC